MTETKSSCAVYQTTGCANVRVRPFEEIADLVERPVWGHDKIGATAYANLDKKGTQQKIRISRKARIVPWIGFRTALWTIAGTSWPNFRLWRQSGVRCLVGVASWLTDPC
jgi:hypothetical protein